jgi:hypothetical protein
LKRLTVIIGIVVTSLLSLIFLTELGGLAVEKGFITMVKKVFNSFFEFSDDPSPFYFTYILGYIIVWWKPLWGSIIIILGSVFYFILANNIWSLIFVLPALLVGILYFSYWWSTKS